jgi:hypothetical protein
MADFPSPIFQVCVVVPDVDRAVHEWASLLGVPMPEVRTVFGDGIAHLTWGQAADYRDLRVALIPLGTWTLELLQPGPGPSPWRAFLDRNGPGVFHFCTDEGSLHRELPEEYHRGVHAGGSYHYHDTRALLGLELSVRSPAMPSQPIRHQVIFDLKHAPGSLEARTFLADGRRILTAIPGVKNFQAARQVSPKNDYQYGFSMEFDTSAAYQGYNDHPSHVAFVKDRWQTEVTRFLEIDFEGA